MTPAKCLRAPLTVMLAVLLFASPSGVRAQWGDRDGWVEEPAAKSLNLEGSAGHSYLDPASIHRGDDGLIYFNESTEATKPEEVGRSGFMKDAYDCARDIKYMCVGIGDWRNDRKSAIHTSDDPALAVYRKYLCGDPDTSTSEASRLEASPAR